MPIRSVTVYCSSSAKVAPLYRDTAHALGRAIAQQAWTLIYGGNYCGCMATLADGARHAGGRVVGITPRLLNEKAAPDANCHEFIITETMRERKALLESRADAFVTLPGGIGTLEEFFEILVGRSLGFHAKPLVLLNVGGFYDPLLEMLRHGIEAHFIRPRTLDMLHVATAVPEAIEHLRHHKSAPFDPSGSNRASTTLPE